MNYYKITLPSKTYVARGHCLSMVAYEFYEQFSFDDADDTSESNEFLAFEPLIENYLKVKGINAVDALKNAFNEYKKSIEVERAELIKECGIAEADDIMDEEYGYTDMEELTTIILEVDKEE